MSHHRPRVTGLLALLAVLVLAPVAGAAAPSDAAPGASKTAKERAYGKHCGSARKASGHSSERAKCLEAMSRLATGKTSSPRKACRALSRKKARGSRTSAYARCVKAGAKLMKSKGRRGGDSAGDVDNGDLDLDLDLDIGAGAGAGAGPGAGGAGGEPDDPSAEPDDDRDPDDAMADDAPEEDGDDRRA